MNDVELEGGREERRGEDKTNRGTPPLPPWLLHGLPAWCSSGGEEEGAGEDAVEAAAAGFASAAPPLLIFLNCYNQY